MIAQLKKPSYLWLIPLTLYIPILLSLPVVMANGELTPQVLTEAACFLPMGFLSGYIMLDALGKAKNSLIRKRLWLAYLISLPLGILTALYYGLAANPLVGPLAGGVLMCTFIFATSFLSRKKNLAPSGNLTMAMATVQEPTAPVPTPIAPKMDEPNDHYDQEWHPEVTDEAEEGDEDEDWNVYDPEEISSKSSDYAEEDDAFLPRPKGCPPPAESPVHRDQYLHHERDLTEYDLFDAWLDADSDRHDHDYDQENLESQGSPSSLDENEDPDQAFAQRLGF